MTKFLLFCLLQCFLLILSAAEIDIYPTPKGISPSTRFRVDIRSKGTTKWQSVFVYQSENVSNHNEQASWASFSFSGEIELRITLVNQQCDAVIIRPKALQINHHLSKENVLLSLTKASKLCIEINGNSDQVLFLFADPIDQKPTQTNGRSIVYFKPGIHNIGDKYKLKSNTTYYIEGGAILRGSFYGEGRLENVTIRGRGIINSGYQKWNHPKDGLQSNISFEDAKNISIEGITCVEAGNFQIKVQSKQDNSPIFINNIKLIGWNKNTDGIHVSDMDWKDSRIIGNAKGIKLFVTDCFIRANDDAILLCDGVAYSEMKNCILWDAGYGSSFCLSWGGHQNVDSCEVDNCYVIHKNGSNPVFRANHAGEGRIQNVRFTNIFIEGSIKSLVGLSIVDHRYDRDDSHGSINNVLFKNITVEGGCGENIINGYSENYTISNIVFQNLRINGHLILSPAEMKLVTNKFVSNINFAK